MGHGPVLDHIAGGHPPRRSLVFNVGFFPNQTLRRILDLYGTTPKIGLPQNQDAVMVWGHSPHSWRGRVVAHWRKTPLIRVEDAFLRSVLPGRSGQAPLGITVNFRGCHYDSDCESDLEHILLHHPLDDPTLLDRADTIIHRIKRAHLSKYCAIDPNLTPPVNDYVLVIDQTRGDAAITHGGADATHFEHMLKQARKDHPDATILIKTHPETRMGYRKGHFSPQDCDANTQLIDTPISPYRLFTQARAVYTVSSQMGFEAILAGHKPHVFGQPFYAGWGLSHDHIHLHHAPPHYSPPHHPPLPRHKRALTPTQLFAGAMMLYPIWYDPYRDQLCNLETVVDALEAQSRAWRDDHHGWRAHHMRLWKRDPLQKFFGQYKRLRFQGHKGPHMVWGQNSCDTKPVTRIEDGFLRSRGLGAALTPPMSLILDDVGMYFDPSQPSRLEQLIARPLDPDQRERAKRLRDQIIAAGLSKYNLNATGPHPLPKGRRILVPGQVEDDASIRLGTRDIRTNLELLQETRRQNPDAVLIYKPHPDVEAGLRKGHLPNAHDIADVIASNTDPIALLAQVDAVWTMTSLLGFEALIRDIPVTCLGLPFYAGWGLTTDRHSIARRIARPDLTALIHATLIAYPRYHDPKTNLPCPVEVILDRLQDPPAKRPPHWRFIARLQGALASYAHLWR